MARPSSLGVSVPRHDAPSKTTGTVKYTDDHPRPGLLHAAILPSPHAHARIRSIDASGARAAAGVRGVFTGEDWDVLVGLYLGDKPPLARGVVRYHGEAVAAVVADSEAQAVAAVRLIRVDYEVLRPLRTPREALEPDAPVLHPDLGSYRHIPAILPEPGTNVANRTKIRKGDAEAAFAAAHTAVECSVSFPPGDHVAMEPRAVEAEIGPDGKIRIRSSTQSPFGVRTLLAKAFGLRERDIRVTAGAVGGGFGGKAGIQLEPLAYLLSKGVGGRPVRLTNSREADLIGSPGRPGLEATVRLAAAADGTLLGADILFLFDSGGYADYAVNVSRAGGYACTGPYRIPAVTADSLCVYTNHPFATAYRGFGHIEMSFAVERAMDALADALGMDPAELRLKNAVRRGDTVPTGDVLDGNTGDLPACIAAVKRRLDWEGGTRTETAEGRVRTKGMACFWKAPAIPTFTDAGAIIQFDEDGSVRVATGVVEIGQGTAVGLRQIAAEALGVEVERVRLETEVDTDLAPHDWTTAASRSLFMAGRAVLDAAADAIAQLKRVAAAPLRCAEEDLEVSGGRVFVRDESELGFPLEKVALGYVYENGNAIGGPVIGRGKYIARRLSGLDPETGAGRPGLEWTLGAEGVEIEADPRTGAFRVLRAACAMDVGRLINPDLARGQVVGAMAMGIGYAVREGFSFDSRGRVGNASLRDYKILRFGEECEYFVDFRETPQGDGPYGARGLGEQGIIGMPGAVARALSLAAGRQLTALPITAETLWRAARGADL